MNRLLPFLKDVFKKYPVTSQICAFAMTFVLGFVLHNPISNMWIGGGTEDGDTKTTEDVAYNPIEEVEYLLMENGTTYSGGVSNGKRQGWGKLTTAKGNVYKGEWNQNALENGTLLYWDEPTKMFVKSWEGSFNKSLEPHGFGKMDYRDSVYIGCYENSYRNGMGRVFGKDGSQRFGLWERGRLKEKEALYHLEDSVYGIDISHYQNEDGGIDWDQLALYCNERGMVYSSEPKEKKYYRPVDFVFIQASKYLIPDRYYYDNLMKARQHYIKVGSYHVFRLECDAHEQAKVFLNYMKQDAGDLPPVLDLESDVIYFDQKALDLSMDSIKNSILQWLDDVEKATGRTPIIYCNNSFAKDHVVNDSRFDRYYMWIARYSKKEFGKVLPDDEIRWSFWQFASDQTKAKANGVSGFIDIDKFDGSYKTFMELFP